MLLEVAIVFVLDLEVTLILVLELEVALGPPDRSRCHP